MPWFDMVLANPLIGVTFQQQWDCVAHFPAAIGHVLTSLDKDGRPFQWSQTSATDHQVKVDNGSHVLILNANGVNVTYEHMARLQRQAGAFPTYTSPSDALSFSEAVDQTVRLLELATGELGKLGKLKADRIGFVLRARVTQEHAPPGILRILEESTRVWPATPRRTKLEVLVPLTDIDADPYIQCHHNVEFDATPLEADISIQLDWQWLKPGGVPLSSGALATTLGTTRTMALEYFQSVGDARALC